MGLGFFLGVDWLNARHNGVVKFSFIFTNIAVFLIACESGINRSQSQFRLYEWYLCFPYKS
jgi:hypothetical protein